MASGILEVEHEREWFGRRADGIRVMGEAVPLVMPAPKVEEVVEVGEIKETHSGVVVRYRAAAGAARTVGMEWFEALEMARRWVLPVLKDSLRTG